LSPEILFIGWLKLIFLPKIDSLRDKFRYPGVLVLIIDGHTVRITPLLIAFVVSKDIMLVQLIVSSTDIAQRFGTLKAAYTQGRESKTIKEETRKIYRILTFTSHRLCLWWDGVL